MNVGQWLPACEQAANVRLCEQAANVRLWLLAEVINTLQKSLLCGGKADIFHRNSVFRKLMSVIGG